MLNASDDEILALFTRVHGEMTGHCYAEVVYDVDGDVSGVACMKGGREAWRSTLAELAVDWAIFQLRGKAGEVVL